MRVSIVLPCRNEARYIGACLDSILQSEYPRDDLEVLVVDGRSDDGTRDIIAAYATRHPRIRLLDNPKAIVPAALNIGIRAASGSVIVRMDAHAVYPPEYVPRLVAALEESGADNVGGCLATLPAGPGVVARGIALALAHPFGVGNAYFRLGTPEARWVDTVPFGCFRRDVFDRVGLFDEDLVRDQDDEFNHRLRRLGGRILLLPDVLAAYYARDSFRALARMYFQYGYYKPLAARKVGRIMTVRQVVPAGFLTGVMAAALLGPVWPAAATAGGLLLGAYGTAVAGAALPAAPRHGARCALALAAAFPVVHLSYGAGFLRGLWHLLWRRHGLGRDPATVPLSR